MNRFLFIAFLYFITSPISAQVQIVSFEEFCNAQLTSVDVPYEKKQSLYPIYFKSPLIDEAELRTETDEFDLARQEYTLRLSPNSKNIRKYQDKIYQNLRQEYLYELRQTQEDQLEDLYYQYLDYYFDSQELNLRKQILPFYGDMITILSKEDKDGEVSMTDLINASKTKDKLELRIERDQNKLDVQKALNSTQSMNIVSVEKIGTFLASFIAIQSPTMIEDHRFELNKIENKYQLEKAERDKRFDFAQLRYSGDPDDVWQEKVSLGFSFRFPHSSGSELDMVELQLERLIEEEKFERRQKEIAEDIDASYLNFNEQFENYLAAEKVVEKLKKYEELTKSIKPQSKGEIVDILELNIDSIEEQLDLINAKKDLYESYIELAKTLGFLQIDQNGLNHKLLSPNLFEFIK